jgi:FkbM family methyltransferase
MLASFRNNLIITWHQTMLNIKKSLKGNQFVLDHDWGKLWYSGDGDRQELLYHIKGSKWYQNEYIKLSKLISPGSTVVDVGANMGFMALIFSRITGKHGRVISLEPSKTTFNKLRKNLEENRLINVICKNIGCASHSMAAELRKLSGSSGHSSLAVSAEEAPNTKAEKVIVDTLDSIVAPYGKVDFLKIDTEGFECEVLEGAQKVLEESRPIVYIELSAQYQESSERSIEILKEAGYVFLSEPRFSGNHSGDNFIAVPAENLKHSA